MAADIRFRPDSWFWIRVGVEGIRGGGKWERDYRAARVVQSRGGTWANHYRGVGVAGDLEAPDEAAIYHSMGPGVLSGSRVAGRILVCATRLVLAFWVPALWRALNGELA